MLEDTGKAKCLIHPKMVEVYWKHQFSTQHPISHSFLFFFFFLPLLRRKPVGLSPGVPGSGPYQETGLQPGEKAEGNTCLGQGQETHAVHFFKLCMSEGRVIGRKLRRLYRKRAKL